MKVVLYGASGMVGSRILRELISRGHEVTAVVRSASDLNEPKAKTVQGDVFDANSVMNTARGADAAISAYGPGPAKAEILLQATRSILSGLEQAGVRRLLMVGGAGSLEVAPGVRLVDAPNFPAEWKPIALAHCDALDALKACKLDWTSLSPAAMLEPGERTGKFRLGKDSFMTDAQGQSKISVEDLAVAMVDELEKPAHIRQRFAVAY